MNKPLTPEELGTMFQSIDKYPNASLKELANIAGLDITKDYIGADFSGEDFNGEDLSNVNFANCNVSNATFVGSNVKNTIFTNSNITQEQLEQSINKEKAIM